MRISPAVSKVCKRKFKPFNYPQFLIKNLKFFMKEQGVMLKNHSESISWIEEELEGCQFKDARHGKRFYKLVESLADGMGESIPYACQD
jgi:hypothetical protein